VTRVVRLPVVGTEGVYEAIGRVLAAECGPVRVRSGREVAGEWARIHRLLGAWDGGCLPRSHREWRLDLLLAVHDLVTLSHVGPRPAPAPDDVREAWRALEAALG
jgi:hypothetical protein